MNPIGVDISGAKTEQAKSAGIEHVYNRNMPGIEEKVSQFTDGYGVDAVIITAGTSSLDPVEFAGEAARHKAKVVIVGAVPTGFSRTNYYKKELELRMSSSRSEEHTSELQSRGHLVCRLPLENTEP